jgi:hypothetical protein
MMDEKQLMAIMERAEASNWEDIHGAVAKQLMDDHDALIEAVQRLQKIAVEHDRANDGEIILFSDCPKHKRDARECSECLARQLNDWREQRDEITRLQDKLIEERARRMSGHCGEYNCDHDLPLSSDGFADESWRGHMNIARTELQSEGRIPK